MVTQMISMYSMLRDCYDRRHFWLNTSLIFFSISLNAFVFASDDVFKAMGLDVTASKISIQVASVLVLVVSIFHLKVDWGGLAKSYGDAADRLSVLKSKYREGYDKVRAGDNTVKEELDQEYARTMEGLARIPERKFNNLKALHYFKVCLSQQISKYPATPVCLLHFLLRVQGVHAVLRAKHENGPPGDGNGPKATSGDVP